MLDGHGSRRPLRGLLTMRFFIFVPPKIYLILRSTAGRQPGRASRPACAKPKRLRFGGGRRTHSAVQHSTNARRCKDDKGQASAGGASDRKSVGTGQGGA